MKMKDNYNEIYKYIGNLKIIDTHEHLPNKEENRLMKTDVIREYLGHYFDRDLVSSGLEEEDRLRVISEDMPVIDKWKILEKHWDFARYTGYGRSLSIAAKDLYGIDRIDRSTIEELNNRFQKLKNILKYTLLRSSAPTSRRSGHAYSQT